MLLKFNRSDLSVLAWFRHIQQQSVSIWQTTDLVEVNIGGLHSSFARSELHLST